MNREKMILSDLTVPTPTTAKKSGIGVDYKYPHNFKGGYVQQDYLPDGIKKKFYNPKDIGYEKNIKNYLQKLQILLENSKSSQK